MRALAVITLAACGRIGFDATAVEHPPPGGLVARWQLDEGHGLVAIDSAGVSDGTLEPGSTVPPAWVPGVTGTALSFTGDGDLVAMSPQTALDNLPAVTVVAWVEAPDVGVRANRGCIVDKGQDQGGWVEFVGFARDGDLAFTANYPSSQVLRSTPANVVAPNVWTRVAITWDGSTAATGVHIYKDGVEQAYADHTDATEPRPDDSSIEIAINCVASTGLPGAIDDVQIYGRVLSPLEISEL